MRKEEIFSHRVVGGKQYYWTLLEHLFSRSGASVPVLLLQESELWHILIKTKSRYKYLGKEYLL